MSQQYYQDPLFLNTASQPEPLEVTPTTVGRSTKAEETAKIQMFNENRDIYRQDFINENTAKLEACQQVATEDSDNTYEIERRGVYYYFIGRLNPPHEGHIEALLNVISNAIDNGGIAIILLGSGPNGGERTSKDPLDFGLKSAFVISKLKDRLKVKYPGLNIDEFFENGRIQISEMGKTTEQIRSVIQNDISNQLFEELEAIRVSGDKDGGEDIKKLAWIEKALSTGIIDKNGNIIPLNARVIAQPAVQSEGKGEPMSATLIRKIVYDMGPSTTVEETEAKINLFRQKTNNFYQTNDRSVRDPDYTGRIFSAIDDNRDLLPAAKKSKPKKGGSKRRKLTKRTSRRRKLTTRRSRRR